MSAELNSNIVVGSHTLLTSTFDRDLYNVRLPQHPHLSTYSHISPHLSTSLHTISTFAHLIYLKVQEMLRRLRGECEPVSERELQSLLGEEVPWTGEELKVRRNEKKVVCVCVCVCDCVCLCVTGSDWE